eukprot:1146030_1
MAKPLKEDSHTSPTLPDKWLCCICHNAAKDPVTLNDDDHLFCRECIDNWFTHRAKMQLPLTHPLTNKDITTHHQLRSQKQIRKEIEKLRVKYKSKKGKEAQAIYEEYFAHFETKNKIDWSDVKAPRRTRRNAPDAAPQKGVRMNGITSTVVNAGHTLVYDDTFGFNRDEISKKFDDNPRLRIILQPKPGYVTPRVLLFTHLRGILLAIGCNKQDIQRWMVQARKHILNRIVLLLNLAKNKPKQYQLLPLLDVVSANTDTDEKTPDGAPFIVYTMVGRFSCKLQYDFEEWKKNHQTYEAQFITEVSKALRLHPSWIQIKNTKAGSVIIDFWILNIWIPCWVSLLDHDPLTRHYYIRPNDQIQIKWKDRPYEATVVKTMESSDASGRRIKARYNPVDGKDQFSRNTEWICSMKEGSRLKLPNQVSVEMDDEGVKIYTTFIPKPIAQVLHVSAVQVGEHLWVSYKNSWYRCQVMEERVTFEGKMIKILYLVHTFMKNEEWLNLWDPNHLARTSLAERP